MCVCVCACVRVWGYWIVRESFCSFAAIVIIIIVILIVVIIIGSIQSVENPPPSLVTVRFRRQMFGVFKCLKALCVRSLSGDKDLCEGSVTYDLCILIRRTVRH